jgi:NAD dependent epimerase/dehydratase family enzyme
VLRRLARCGLGGSMGGGKQFVSWIHEDDFCRAVAWLLERDDFNGVVNVAAPHPVPNAELMRIFRRVCGAPFGLPAARWMLEFGAFFLRTETELIVKSRKVVPARLLESGFQFRFSEIEAALREIEGRLGTSRDAAGGCHARELAGSHHE